ncbi:MAG: hypothetical protein QMD16_17550 [Desulfitobacteriaceae bacterium]|nr:hypothetical protein [Desulfitobacteriaceae bacterium]
MAIVRREEVIDSWAVLIGGSQGRAEEIFTNTDSFIDQGSQHQEGEEKAGPGDNPGSFCFTEEFLEWHLRIGNNRLGLSFYGKIAKVGCK